MNLSIFNKSQEFIYDNDRILYDDKLGGYNKNFQEEKSSLSDFKKFNDPNKQKGMI